MAKKDTGIAARSKQKGGVLKRGERKRSRDINERRGGVWSSFLEGCFLFGFIFHKLRGTLADSGESGTKIRTNGGRLSRLDSLFKRPLALTRRVPLLSVTNDKQNSSRALAFRESSSFLRGKSQFRVTIRVYARVFRKTPEGENALDD